MTMVYNSWPYNSTFNQKTLTFKSFGQLLFRGTWNGGKVGSKFLIKCQQNEMDVNILRPNFQAPASSLRGRPVIKQVSRQQLADRDDEEVRYINKRLGQCISIQEIVNLLEGKVNDLNVICTSTAIYNISKQVIKQHPDRHHFENCSEPGKCGDKEFTPCASSSIYFLKDVEQESKQGCSWLISDLCRQFIKIVASSKDPDNVAFSAANMVYSIGWMHYDPGGRMLDQLAAICQRHLDHMTTQGISNSLQGFAYLNLSGPAIRAYVRAAALKSLDRLQEFKSRELAVAMWAMSTLDSDNKPVSQFLLAAKDLIQSQLSDYSFTDLSTILYSLAYSSLKKQDIQPLFQKLAAEEHFIPSLPRRRFVCGAVIALNAYAKAYKENYGKVPYTVRTGVGRFVFMISQKQQYLTRKDVVMAAWGLGVFRLAHFKLVDAIRQKILKHLDTYDLYDSCNLFWAMGSLRKDVRGNVSLYKQRQRVQCCEMLFKHIIYLLQESSKEIHARIKQNKGKQKRKKFAVNSLHRSNNNINFKQDSGLQIVDVRWITQIVHTSTQLNIITPDQFLELVEVCSDFLQKGVFSMDSFLSDILIRSYTILKSSCDPETRMKVDQSLLMQQAVSQK